jgi:hypothetical protein
MAASPAASACQRQRRTLGGFDARHAFDWRFGGFETQTRVGLQTRYDDIHVGLFKTEQRALLSTVREDRVQEGNVDFWTDTTTRWNDWLRTTVGIREDIFAGRVLIRGRASAARRRITIEVPVGESQPDDVGKRPAFARGTPCLFAGTPR